MSESVQNRELSNGIHDSDDSADENVVDPALVQVTIKANREAGEKALERGMKGVVKDFDMETKMVQLKLESEQNGQSLDCQCEAVGSDSQGVQYQCHYRIGSSPGFKASQIPENVNKECSPDSLRVQEIEGKFSMNVPYEYVNN